MGLERHRHDCVYKFYLSGGTGIDLWIGKLSCRSLGAFHFLFVSFPCYFIGYIEQSSSVRANGQHPPAEDGCNTLSGSDRASVALMSEQV